MSDDLFFSIFTSLPVCLACGHRAFLEESKANLKGARGSVAVCLQSGKPSLVTILCAVHQPNFSECFMCLAVITCLHGPREVARVIGVVRGLGGNVTQAHTVGLRGRGGPGLQDHHSDIFLSFLRILFCVLLLLKRSKVVGYG